MTGWLSNLRARCLSRIGLAGAEQDDIPRWLAGLPASILFLDVRTTGLSAADRVVTFGAVQLTTAPLQEGQFELQTAHLIFNPRRTSFARAEQVHGYSDWILRHQDKFYLHAERIEDLLESSDLIVIHDAEFGLKFLNRELALDGRHPIWRPTYCTMKAYQRLRWRGGASLDAICEQLALPRPAQQQSALESAWLVMLTYLWLNKCPYRPGFPAELQSSPSNLKAPPRLPASLMPRGQARPEPPVRQPAASLPSEPFRLIAIPVPTRATAAPSARPAPQPIRVSVTPVPAPTSITTVADEPMRLSELAQSPMADALSAKPAETIAAPASAMPARPAPASAATMAQMNPAEAPAPLPANDLNPCVDDAPALTFIELPVQLPEVLMPETSAEAAAMPPDDRLHSPADLMLPALAFDGERPANPAAQEFRLLVD